MSKLSESFFLTPADNPDAAVAPDVVRMAVDAAMREPKIDYNVRPGPDPNPKGNLDFARQVLARAYAPHKDSPDFPVHLRDFLYGTHRLTREAVGEVSVACDTYAPGSRAVWFQTCVVANHAYDTGVTSFASHPYSHAARMDESAPGDYLVEGLMDKHVLKAVFVMGSGGAGKGLVSKAMFGGEGLKVINQDTHFERMLSKAQIPMKQAGANVGLFYKAKQLRAKELEHYAKRRLGLLIDMTGWEFTRVADPFNRLRELGYDVHCVFIRTSLATALRRNEERGKAGGRHVPDSYIRDAWNGAERNLPQYRKLFGRKRFWLIDNDQDIPAEAFRKYLYPVLHNTGKKILNAPLANPVGRRWLAAQRKNPTLDTPDPVRKTDYGKTPWNPGPSSAPKLPGVFFPKDSGTFKEAKPRASGGGGPINPQKVNQNPWAPRKYNKPTGWRPKRADESRGMTVSAGGVTAEVEDAGDATRIVGFTGVPEDADAMFELLTAIADDTGVTAFVLPPPVWDHWGELLTQLGDDGDLKHEGNYEVGDARFSFAHVKDANEADTQ